MQEIPAIRRTVVDEKLEITNTFGFNRKQVNNLIAKIEATRKDNDFRSPLVILTQIFQSKFEQWTHTL